jgi:hypothetical protein
MWEIKKYYFFKKILFFWKIRPELPNGVISMPTVMATGSMPRMYCADGEVPTATVGTGLCRRQF